MIETFLFMRLGKVWWHVAWKLQKCRERGGRKWCKHEAGLHVFGRKIWNIHLACFVF